MVWKIQSKNRRNRKNKNSKIVAMKVVPTENKNSIHPPATIPNPIALLSIWLIIGMAVSGCGSEKPEQPRNYPDKGTAQAQLYMDKCGQCHAAPLPSAHTAKTWPSVLDRMQMRMKTKHVPPLTREEMSIIFGYLQQHAKKSTQQPFQQKMNGN
jgi:hypothetical protein